MTEHKISKRPGDAWTVAIDFTGRVPETGGAPASVVTSAVDRVTQLSAPEVLGAAGVSNMQARFAVQGGVVDRSYDVRILVTLTTGEVLEEKALITIV